jgi:hypothetical protein
MTTSAAPEYRDRKTGLIIFGIFEILLGGLCALFLLILLANLALRPADATAPPAPITPVLFVYVLGAVAFIWLGIGSVAAQRWARALLLCLSAVGLFFGLFGIAILSLIVPQISQAVQQAAAQGGRAIPPDAARLVAIGTVAALSVVYILLPGALFLFYRSPHVRRTCEARDPVERWTDRCPLPVLAFCLVGALGEACFLNLQLSMGATVLFGVTLTGAVNDVVAALIAGWCLYLVWGLYRLRLRAWWLMLASQGLCVISNVITAYRYDLTELYIKMGFDNRMAYAAGHMVGPAFRWLMPSFILPSLVWLLFLRRYFEPPALPAQPPLIDDRPRPF